MSHQAQKGSDLIIGLWGSESGISFEVLLARSYNFLGDMVSQVVDLILKEFTLGWLELQVVFPEVLKCNLQAMLMFLFHLWKDDHVIQVDQTVGVVQLTQTVLHQSLECGWGITQPEQHAFTFEESYVPHSKSHVLLWSLIHHNLPNPAFKSKQEKYPAQTRLSITSCICGIGKSPSRFSHSIYEMDAEM